MAVEIQPSAETKKLKTKAKASLALLVVALISISTATYAWFTLSNSVSVQSMVVEVGTGTVLKAYAGTTASTNTENYFAIIKSEGTAGTQPGELITGALPTGITKLTDVKFWPVSSGDGKNFFTQGTNVVAGAPSILPEKRYYLDLTFTFITDSNMDVYLNGSDSASGVTDSTLVAPNTAANKNDQDAVKALRISFTSPDGNTVIYEPGRGTADTTVRDNAAGGIGTSKKQSTFWTLGDNIGRHKGEVGVETPVLFTLEKGVPKVIKIRMWAEGEDAECLNTGNTNIEQAKMNVRLRFCGADPNGHYLETPIT